VDLWITCILMPRLPFLSFMHPWSDSFSFFPVWKGIFYNYSTTSTSTSTTTTNTTLPEEKLGQQQQQQQQNWNIIVRFGNYDAPSTPYKNTTTTTTTATAMILQSHVFRFLLQHTSHCCDLYLMILSFTCVLPLLVLPRIWVFGYVQTLLLVVYGIQQLSCVPRAQKRGLEYALTPLLSSLPLGCIAWAESTLCRDVMMDVGGHVVFDACIGLSLLALYASHYTILTQRENTITATTTTASSSSSRQSQ